MPAAVSYTDEEFRQWLKEQLLATADALGWTDVDHAAYTSAVARVERVLGGTIAEQTTATQLIKLEAAGAVEIWRNVLAERSQDYDFSTLAGKDERSDAFAQAEKMFKQALARAGGLGLYPEETTPASSGQPRSVSRSVRNEVVW